MAVPTYGPLPSLTAFSLIQSQSALADAGIAMELAILEGHCHVDDARNHLVAEFLKSDCDDLLFIDADMGWQPEAIVRMAGHDADVVGATYRKKKDEEEYPVQLPAGALVSRNGLLAVEGLPTGFLKINRDVFFAMRKGVNWFCPDIGQEPIGEYFFREIVDGNRVSGDYSFCHRWCKAGGTVYVDPEIRLEHLGGKRFDGSLGAFLRRRNGLAMREQVAKIRAGTETDADIIDLWDEWGNNQWAGGHELIKTLIGLARQAKGPILECGSGVSSIAMAAAGAEVHVLEHDPVWMSKLADAAKRLSIDIRIHYAPLELYEGGRWYRENPDIPWNADIIVCDGPPRQLGERSVLFERMAKHGSKPRCILQDDIHRIEDAPAMDGYAFEVVGKLRPFLVGRHEHHSQRTDHKIPA